MDSLSSFRFKRVMKFHKGSVDAVIFLENEKLGKLKKGSLNDARK